MDRTDEEVVSVLIENYETGFGGKDRGRFKISRSNLRRLVGRKRLENSISGIIDAALERGYIVIDLGDYFAVVQEAVMKNYRPVPKSVLAEYFKKSTDPSALEDED